MAKKKKKKDELPLDYGIGCLSIVQMRQKPDIQSAICSQLLFGELFTIVSRKSKKWIKIECALDKCSGWINPQQVHLLNTRQYLVFQQNVGISIELAASLTADSKSFPILIGSSLPGFDGMSFKMPDGKYIFNGQAIMTDDRKPSPELLVKIAKKYLNTPYQSGGRSPFGIDASGLTQMIFKIMGIPLPRHAAQQSELGEIIDFVLLSKEGDLAFFIDKENKINHVGIMYGENEIIHVDGHVRIDRLDHEGIYNVNTKKYTHRLKFVKRIL